MIYEGLVERTWQVFILATLVLLATACSPAATPTVMPPAAQPAGTTGSLVKVELSAATVQVDGTFKALIKVEKITNLTGVELHLAFDPKILEVAELVAGDMIKADFLVENGFDNQAGTIDYAVAQINGKPANGDGTLLQIVFRAKDSGSSAIGFRATKAAPAGAILADSAGAAIPVALLDGKVDVSK